ncbi:uncharacterized protein JCM6883_005969 [Sporobolomyces salmoneus]|uniref:uncharacterized protein n=1 Tax=Sporobolomyces salmoneus TaxID=183962 RepID=UPI00317981B4
MNPSRSSLPPHEAEKSENIPPREESETPKVAPAPDLSPPASDVKGDPFEIDFLLMSGARKRWRVGSEETVEQVRQRIHSEWPTGYNLKPPQEEGQPPTIVHLHIRTIPLEEVQDDSIDKPRKGSTCRCCTIS